MIVKRKVKKKVTVSATSLVVRRKDPSSVVGAAPSPAVIRRAFKTGKAGELVDERRETERKKKLAHLISLNIGSKAPRSMYQMMVEAGYAESTARARSKEILDSIRDEPVVQDTLQRLHRIRDKMLKRVEDTADQGTAATLAFPMQVILKEIALIEGKPTDRVDHTLTAEEKDELDDIIRMNS